MKKRYFVSYLYIKDGQTMLNNASVQRDKPIKTIEDIQAIEKDFAPIHGVDKVKITSFIKF